MKSGTELIGEAREEQIDEGGYTAEHDRKHIDGYLVHLAQDHISTHYQKLHFCLERRRNGLPESDEDLRVIAWELAKAGACLAAEIDRLRAEWLNAGTIDQEWRP